MFHQFHASLLQALILGTVLVCAVTPAAGQSGKPSTGLPSEEQMMKALEITPNEGNSRLAVRPPSQISVQLLFKTDSEELSDPKQKAWVENIAAKVILSPSFAGRTFVVEGHTDTRGSDLYNLNLSERRAKAIRDLLIRKGVPATKLRAIGKGEYEPASDGNSDEAHQKNRRVLFIRE